MTNRSLPLITAVIPTRWRSDLVVRAVRSALDQTYPKVEVVVVIDGPDTMTVRALEELGDSRVRVRALADNVGGSEARNIGVLEARGRWIALLDDDDEWLPSKLERQMAAVACIDGRHCLATCRRYERQPGCPDILAPRRGPRAGEDVSEYLFYSDDGKRHTSGPQTSGYLGTKDLFVDVPFSRGLKCHQDWDWYLRAMRNGRTVAVWVDEPLYIMHVEPTRARVTKVARWELSLSWLESRRGLFTERAYMSFLINECMYRCEETKHRARVFRILLNRCTKTGKLRLRDVSAMVKWYLFRPSVRLRVSRSIEKIRASLRGAAVSSCTVDTLPAKQEVQG